MAFVWRSRRATSGDERSLRLTDSQVAVAVKGRSSSKRLNKVLRRFEGFIFALLLCSLQFCRGRNDPLRTAARPIGRARVKMAFHPTKEGPQRLCDLETW